MILSIFSIARKRGIFPLAVLCFILQLSACKKMIAIPPPVRTLTSRQVFSTNQEAVAALTSAYSQLINSEASFANLSTTIYCGLSADEFTMQYSSTSAAPVQFLVNDLTANNSILNINFWAKAYSIIYITNAVIEGLQNNNAVSDSVKTELIGEAKFLRAFCNFYLVNLFGSIPLVTTANWRNTNLLGRAPVNEVYALIKDDLKDAEAKLPPNYTVAKGQKIIPNKTAAAALLARAYLYSQEWSNAETMASTVIDNAALSLTDVQDVFKTNSKEAIWQLKQSNAFGPGFNVTPEGNYIIPRVLNANLLPPVWLTTDLLTAFERDDQRKTKWVDSTRYSLDKMLYFFPSKYKGGPAQAVSNGSYTEYYMVLRLAEQYLIRAEARLMQNKLPGAVADLNVIRTRAGLPPLAEVLPAEDIMSALIRERRIELFAEWGHRWLDLKRWNLAGTLLSSLKGNNWQSTDALYPIPLQDLTTDPSLTQNEGYQ